MALSDIPSPVFIEVCLFARPEVKNLHSLFSLQFPTKFHFYEDETRNTLKLKLVIASCKGNWLVIALAVFSNFAFKVCDCANFSFLIVKSALTYILIFFL